MTEPTKKPGPATTPPKETQGIKKVLIIGGGFAGLKTALQLGNNPQIAITLIDRSNHHLFQPLLYQVAMAGLSPAEIAYPIRGLLSAYTNVEVLMAEAKEFDFAAKKVVTSTSTLSYDYLILACGSQHFYFGHNDWEEHAPGLKTLAQATEIRRRVLSAFEMAASETDLDKQRQHLTFVIIGGGPTGVELAGAIGELSRHSINKDFKQLDISRTRIVLLEGSKRILNTYSEDLSKKAMRDLENLGVQVWTSSLATKIDASGVYVGQEFIKASTVLWAAGVTPSKLNKQTPFNKDPSGRILVDSSCRVPNFPEVFVIGDQAAFKGADGKMLPGLAPVAMQQGAYVGKWIAKFVKTGKSKKPFHYVDKGQMATIGRKRAVLQAFGFEMTGLYAWMAWLFVHIYYLIGFKNKMFVFMEWAWAYLTYKKGARLILAKEWKFYSEATPTPANAGASATSSPTNSPANESKH
jgi:NADH dehydrogenase